jgi:hypothetical protein
VTVVAGSEDARELVNTICEVVGRLGLPVRARTLEQAPAEGTEETSTPGLARAEIDVTSPNVAQVLVYGKSGQVVLMQRFARNASAAVLREEIADAVRSAVEAQLLIEPERQGQTTNPGLATGAPPPPPPPLGRGSGWVSPFSAAVPPVAEPPALVLPVAPPMAPVERPSGEATSPPKVPMRGVAVDLSALAGIGGFSWQTSVVGHLGGEVAVAYRKWLNPSLSMTGEYVPPFGARSGLQASVASLRVVPAIQVFHASSFAIDAGAGAGIDVINVEPSPLLPNGATRIDPVLRGMAAARLGLAPRIILSVMFAYDLDVALHRPRFAMREDPSIPVMATWLARPVGLVGLTFAAIGDARFASGLLR